MNDKPRNSAPVHLWCGGLFSYNITMYLLLSLLVKKSMNTWRNYRPKVYCLAMFCLKIKIWPD